MKNSTKKIFDSTICFTCFQPWVEAIKETAETDPVKALSAFFAIADFCLYGIEPDAETNPWGMAWPVISAEARRSINNRRRGFGAEDTALSKLIIDYHLEHPDASQRSIADALSCSVGKVNKVLKSLSPSPECGIDSYVHNDNSNDIVSQYVPTKYPEFYENPPALFDAAVDLQENGGAF